MQVLLEDLVSCPLWELLIQITEKILSRWVQREILTVLFTSIAMGSLFLKNRVTTSLFGISFSREEEWRETLLGYALLIRFFWSL